MIELDHEVGIAVAVEVAGDLVVLANAVAVDRRDARQSEVLDIGLQRVGDRGMTRSAVSPPAGSNVTSPIWATV